ncbi:MAG: cellulase family glycosylhydrolase [Ignavibacteriales bacterium]|nr:cellulase family glycosylhydrolase [Ignavibacteriales bacterium]
MTTIRSAALLLILAAATLPAQDRFIYDKLLRPPGAAFYQTPIGLCEDYPEETTTLEIIRKDMELLKRSGINLLRISFGWDAIEAQKDEYDWLFWDDYVRIAAEEYGITLIPYICYTPMWNSTGDTTNFWNHTPKDYEEFGQFVYDLVMRYKKWIKSWELWNEPDIHWYWSGDSKDLARLTKIGSQAVRKADPDALVVLAGLAHDVNFTKSLFRDHGISPYVNVVNIHNYYETWSGTPNENVTDYVNAVADVVQMYGDDQSIWMAEVGYSTFRMNGRISESYTALHDYEHTPRYQAVHLVRTLTMLLSTEKLAAIAWYEIKDLTSHEDVIGDDNNRHLGVATLHHEAKPAEHALAFSNRLFSKKIRSIDAQTVVTKRAGGDAVIHAFEQEDGNVIVVGWLRTFVRGTRTNGMTGSMKDTRSEVVDVRLPAKLRGTVAAFDDQGSRTAAPKVERSARETTIRGWTLRGGEVSIITLSK